MATVVVVFGAHSLIDWTWFVPGNAVLALLCAGVGGRPRAAAHARHASRCRHGSRSRGGARRGRSRSARSPCWASGWSRAGRRCSPCARRTRPDDALDLAQLGKYDAAAAKARRSGELNPLSVDPLFQLAFIADARGDKRARRSSALERATQLQPANVEAWRRLGRYRLSVLNDPGGASRRSASPTTSIRRRRRVGVGLLEASRALKAQGG